MEESLPPRVVLDSNVIVSAIIFGGKPQVLLKKAYKREIQGIISEIILAGINDVFVKHFEIPTSKLKKLNRRIRAKFDVVNPRTMVKVSRDPDDNKILEAAVEGTCDYIVTGDKDLLDLRKYKNIKILSPAEFLKGFEK